MPEIRGLGPRMPRACPVESHARHHSKTSRAKSKMPRACPVESHARHYSKISRAKSKMPRARPVEFSRSPPTQKAQGPNRRCHGLRPVEFSRSPLQSKAIHNARMPRARPVESHARHLQGKPFTTPGCHGLAPLSLTLATTKESHSQRQDATGLPRGASRSPLQKFDRLTCSSAGVAKGTKLLAQADSSS